MTSYIHSYIMETIVLLVLLLLAVGFSNASSITAAQLQAIMPHCRHPEYLDYINSALAAGKLDTCDRQSAFLAQIAHESGELRYMEELASGQEYEGRLDLGNTKPGDGKRYKGRGPIQLTGRTNYQKAGEALGLDLIKDPAQVKTPEVGFRTSVWFWTNLKLNALADQNTLAAFRKITKKINGGTNGQADREMYWAKAKTTLGCATTTRATATRATTTRATTTRATTTRATTTRATTKGSLPTCDSKNYSNSSIFVMGPTQSADLSQKCKDCCSAWYTSIGGGACCMFNWQYDRPDVIKCVPREMYSKCCCVSCPCP